MTAAPGTSEGGHLDYYKAHGIAPVHYDLVDLQAHFDRREALYRSLGLPAVAFKGVDVLEVAPGTGQNSTYVATRRPRTLHLVEPNPAGLAAISATYAGLTVEHTRPLISDSRLEEFDPGRSYDVVICENWLGALPSEQALIGKLASLVSPGGCLVLTVVPLSGFFPNVMRKLLALRIAPPTIDFETRTSLLVRAFGPHLATMPAMTRSHRDWVHDCMINPHYLNVALPLETALAAVGPGMEILQTFPRFAPDWRWFKGLVGSNRRFNEVVLEAQEANIHNFIDHRRVLPARPAGTDAGLDRAFVEAHKVALAWQAAFLAGDAAAVAQAGQDIERLVAQIGGALSLVDPESAAALAEFAQVWRREPVDVETVAGMGPFAGLFGRETVYVSMTRTLA